MATEPQWRRPWEERPAEEHQSSPSLVSVTSNQQITTPLYATSPFNTAGSGPPPSHARRLPPLHASLDASAEAVQPPPSSSRRPSLNSSAHEITSPNIAWQYEASASSNKRKRMRGAEPESYPTHAYSSPSHDAPTPQSSQLPVAVPQVLPDKYIGYGGHATRPATVTEVTRPVDSRRPSQDLYRLPGPLTNCCTPRCTGKRCSTVRALVADLTSEFSELDLRLQGAISGSVQSPRVAPDVEQAGLTATLEWVIERLRWNNAGIRSLVRNSDQALQDKEPQIAQQSGALPPPLEGDADPATTAAEDSEAMKRRRSQSDKEGTIPSRRAAPPLQPAPAPGTVYSPAPLAGPSRQAPSFSPGMPEESWRNPYVQPGEQPPVSHSPHRTVSSSGSVFHPSQHSPMQAPQYPPPQGVGPPGRPFLPSPSALTFPPLPQPSAPPQLAVGGPGASPLQQPQVSSPAHVQHLQDLQHQVSVKTLALQTLQREYDALLAKLERQRTKCITLEKKFEVSDVEINSLTEERERLQAQVAALESQADELTRGRDDARREMAESGRQYVRIVEMASRLQAQGADERKRWEDERRELMDRVRTLELGLPEGEGEMEIGEGDVEAALAETALGELETSLGESAGGRIGESSAPEWGSESTTARPESQPAAEPEAASASATSGVASKAPATATTTPTRRSPNPIPALRAEVRRLRSRTQALEGVIRTMREENASMQEALLAVTASGQRMQESMDRALGA
ncbi:hypothetical protein NA57DRAFT_79349 [Rhizodiscina lignyota]|uniref:Uncharacterized protein n=1 Tax=Rhizodiscina lignyota TaxID=1504668 RepID=A0A9P4I9I7_9PEZI|nr:hypothetical protein NA57DRAFT_79349 [Rhizodiscina lignyota]